MVLYNVTLFFSNKGKSNFLPLESRGLWPLWLIDYSTSVAIWLSGLDDKRWCNFCLAHWNISTRAWGQHVGICLLEMIILSCMEKTTCGWVLLVGNPCNPCLWTIRIQVPDPLLNHFINKNNPCSKWATEFPQWWENRWIAVLPCTDSWPRELWH